MLKFSKCQVRPKGKLNILEKNISSLIVEKLIVLQQRLIFYFLFYRKKKNLFPLEEVSNSD